MTQYAAKKRLRRLKAGLRDILLLINEFKFPLAIFFLIIIGFGTSYYQIALTTSSPVNSLSEAIYLILSLIFLQSSIPFPKEWYLQIFFFLMPILGLAILAQGLTDFAILFFNRKARGKDWEMAVASTFSNHIILIGLGHLGYHVVQILNQMGEDVVVIEQDPKADLVTNVKGMGIPVIEGDGTKDHILLSARIDKASTIMLCTQNDSMNLQMAVKARSLKPKIRVIIRIFDEDFAKSLSDQFGFYAFSATGMAAPVFAATAAGVDITPPISIGGQPNALARLDINSNSALVGMKINEIEDRYQISIVTLIRNNIHQPHPPGNITIEATDTLAILGNPTQITTLITGNHH